MRNRLIFLLIVPFLTYSCDRELVNSGFPAIIMTSVSGNGESLLFSGKFLRNSPGDSDEVGFIWQAGEDPLSVPGFRIRAEKDGPDRFGALISTSIKKDIEYYIRSYVSSGEKIVYSEILRYSAGSDLPCILYGFEPAEGYGGDTVEISGSVFNLTALYNRVYFDNTPSVIIGNTDTTLTCIAPASSEAGPRSVRVIVNGVEKSFTGKYNLLVVPDPQISSVSQTSIKYCDTLTVYGAHFNNVDEVILGGSGINIRVVPLLITPDSMKIEIYNQENPLQILGFSNFKIGVTKDNTTIWSEWINILSSWTRLADFPGNPRYKAGCFSLGGKIYAGCGAVPGYVFKDIWKFDPSSGLWTRMADITGNPRIHPAGFSSNTHGYMGAGFSTDNSLKVPLYDFYKYDPVSNSWSVIPSYPDLISVGYVGYTVSVMGQPFAALSNTVLTTRKLVDDNWQSAPAVSEVVDCNQIATFSINNYYYVVIGYTFNNTISNSVWEYNTINNTWIKKGNFPGPPRNSGMFFSIGKYGYFGCGRSSDPIQQYDDIWRFEPETDKWIRIEDFTGGNRSHTVSLSDGVYGYAGLGWTSSSTWYNDFWRYDPN